MDAYRLIVLVSHRAGRGRKRSAFVVGFRGRAIRGSGGGCASDNGGVVWGLAVHLRRAGARVVVLWCGVVCGRERAGAEEKRSSTGWWWCWWMKSSVSLLHALTHTHTNDHHHDTNPINAHARALSHKRPLVAARRKLQKRAARAPRQPNRLPSAPRARACPGRVPNPVAPAAHDGHAHGGQLPGQGKGAEGWRRARAKERTTPSPLAQD